MFDDSIFVNVSECIHVGLMEATVFSLHTSTIRDYVINEYTDLRLRYF